MQDRLEQEADAGVVYSGDGVALLITGRRPVDPAARAGAGRRQQLME
jgi:hypothetical protein